MSKSSEVLDKSNPLYGKTILKSVSSSVDSKIEIDDGHSNPLYLKILLNAYFSRLFKYTQDEFPTTTRTPLYLIYIYILYVLFILFCFLETTGVFDDNSIQFPPVQAPPPGRDIVRPRAAQPPQWRSRAGNTTTPYCPPPHKGQDEQEHDRTQGTNEWQKGSVVEQA